MKDGLPLTAIHEAILDFLKGRSDSVIFGAHAVNAYVPEPRATQDVDIMSLHPEKVAETLRDYLAERLRIAVRVRIAESGTGPRVYQIRKEEGNRHLADIRAVEQLPATQLFEGIAVLDVVPLIAAKVIAVVRRKGRPKSLTDARDIAVLLLAFPELKRIDSPVTELLSTEDPVVQSEWRDWVNREILPEEDDY